MKMEEDRRKGERRQDFCPLHESHCKEIESIKTKVPIWVFIFFSTAVLSAIGWLNYDISKKADQTQTHLALHIRESNRLQKRVIRGLNTFSWNQRRVMTEINLPFQEFPEIEIE